MKGTFSQWTDRMHSNESGWTATASSRAFLAARGHCGSSAPRKERASRVSSSIGASS